MLEKIMLALFKGFFALIGFIIKSVYRLISDAIGRNSRAVYAPPNSAATPASTGPPPLSESAVISPPLPVAVNEPPLPDHAEPDARFEQADALLSSGSFTECLQSLRQSSHTGLDSSEWRLKLAHRYLLLWRAWSAGWPEPVREGDEDAHFDEHLIQMKQREFKLREPLEEGCAQIETVLSSVEPSPLAVVLGRELHGQLAQSCWNWGPKKDGFVHQKRVIELSSKLIDYDTLDLAQRCALEAQIFGDFFDMTEALFKSGRIEVSEHFYAAMVYEGAVHSEEWPLSNADQKRAAEFLKAALAHLEYCDRHNLEKGAHWHNIMARVLASRGKFDDALYHFGQFKSLAAKSENGDAMIAVFGNPTVRIIKAYNRAR